MKKCFIYIVCVLLVLFMGCTKINKTKKHGVLSSADSMLFSRPDSALMLIKKCDENKLSEDDYYYCQLLKIIASKNLYLKIDYGAKIDSAFTYYYLKKNKVSKQSWTKKDEFDFARVSLYWAIIRHKSEYRDSIIYPMIKDAQLYFNNIKEASYYKATVYSHLARINSDVNNKEIAEKYYSKAIDEFKKLNDVDRITLLKIDKAWYYLVAKRYDLLGEILNDIQNNNLFSDDVAFAFYSLCTAYYASAHNYECAIEFMKKKDELKDKIKWNVCDRSKIYLSVSKYYSFINNADSAILYAQKAIENVVGEDDIAERLHYYYRNLGDIYSKGKLYYEASMAYRKAFAHAVSSSSLMNKNRKIELEGKYKDLQMQASKEKENSQRILLQTIGFSFIMLVVLLLILVLYKTRLEKTNKKNIELKQHALEKELKQSKSMVDIVSISLGVLPKFIDKVNELSAKTFSMDPQLYEGFQREISAAKMETRKRLLDIVNDQTLMESSPFLKYLDSLSNQEKMIVLLLQQNYSTKYISSVLNVSQSSIRGSKVKIKGKIKLLDIEPKIKDELLNIL